MPIRINLKELFASDAQEMFIDKTNFNFNKLLELGIGDPGVQGLTGLTGSAGPSGNQGGQGQRGNKWFVGIGDPTSQVFTDLIENDFYLDTDTSSIWQYQGSPASWIEIADLSEIVTTIIENEGAPFVRGFGEASPLDDRYILFTKRGNDLTDVNQDTSLGNDANNDILLLNNWNERFTDISDFPMNTSSEYNAIQQISVDHTISTLGRYHLELGSLYTTPTSGANVLLSTISHNLKVKYTKDTSGSTLYPISNAIINTADFSMSKPVTAPPTDITEQGMFKFTVPKYNDDGPAVRDEVYLRIGTTEALSEDSGLSIVSDGLEIRSAGSVDATVSLGMKRELESSSDILTLNPSLYGNFGIIDTSSTLNGLMIKGDTYHTLGNLSHIQTSSEFEYSVLDTFPTAPSTQGQQGIFSDGQYLFAVSPGTSLSLEPNGSAPLTAEGMMKVWDISNPDRPFVIASEVNDSITEAKGAVNQTTFDNNGNPNGDGPYPGLNNSRDGRFNNGPPLTGVRDVAFAGKYGCYVRKKPTTLTGSVPPNSSRNYDTFVMFELDSTDNSIKFVSSLGTSLSFAQFMTGSEYNDGDISPYFDDLRRVKISGNWAYVMSSRSLLDGVDPTTSFFMAVDITAPTRPIIDEENIHVMLGHINVDFDIHDNIAYILSTKWTALNQYELTLTKKQLFPQPLWIGSTAENEQILISPFSYAQLPVNGSVKVIGNKLYLVWGNRFHIYNTKQSVLNDAILLDEYLDLDSEFRDIEISGNYAYVLTEPNTGGSQIVTFDISDPYNILRITPTSTAVTDSPSRMTLTGNRIFSIHSAPFEKSPGSINSTKITGIESSVGRIGSLQSDHIKVSNDVSISQTLQVGRSATIGSGGLWVDQGTGIHSEGVIVSKMPSSVPSNSTNTVQGMSTIASGIYPISTAFGFGIIPQIIGNSISLEKIGANSIFPVFTAGQTIGTKISLSDININPEENIVGVKIDISGFTTSTGISYGIYSTGEDNNYFSSNVDSEGGFRVISDGSGNGLGLTKGIGFYGIGANNPDTQPEDPNIRDGQWHIEYLGANGLNSPLNGLNFWKPFNSTNWGNHKLFLSDNGNVGINTNNPTAKLSVAGVSAQTGLTVDGNFAAGYMLRVSNGAGDGRGMWVRSGSNGAVDICAVFSDHDNLPTGTNFIIYNDGTATTQGTSVSSDIRLKENIKSIANGIEIISKLNPTEFDYKSSGKHKSGFIAQEIKEIIPHAVLEEAQSLQKDNPIKNMLYLDSDQIIPYAVKAIQEQQKIIELLSSRLDELENKIK